MKKLSCILGALACASAASAQLTLLVDFNTAGGEVLGGGAVWNSLAEPTDGVALVDTTGAATGLSFSDFTLDTAAGQGYLTWGVGANYASVSDSGTNRATFADGIGDASWVPAEAVDDYFFGGGVNGVGIELSGFAANQSGITLELFASNSGSRTAMYFVQGVTVDGVAVADADPNVDFFDAGSNLSTVLTWSNVQADSLGRVYLEADARDASLTGARFNALRVTAIPEPSTYAAILGLLSLGFLCWRRSRA